MRAKKIKSLREHVDEVEQLQAGPQPGGHVRIRLKDRGDGWKVFGAVADTHLGSKHYRADVLNGLYDWFEREGVSTVFHGGNWIEGESRFNKHDISVRGLDGQIDYFLEHYPQKARIKTYYVSGDDHEGWYQQREQVNIGKHLYTSAVEKSRKDLYYLGYVEADVELAGSQGSAVMRVMHCGGGSAYAISYRPQQIINSLAGGEKPAVLLIGHPHKLSYNIIRNVHVLQLGATCDQSIFLRKKSIEVHLGGWLVRLKQGRDGAITDFVPHVKTFFNKGFYERYYD